MLQNLALTFIDYENIEKEAEQTYSSSINFEEFSEVINQELAKHNLKNCGTFCVFRF